MDFAIYPLGFSYVHFPRAQTLSLLKIMALSLWYQPSYGDLPPPQVVISLLISCFFPFLFKSFKRLCRQVCHSCDFSFISSKFR